MVYNPWIFSKLVVDKQDREVGNLKKQDGHPVSPGSIGFSVEEKLYTKEACDFRAHYSTILPFPSNQNSQSIGISQRRKLSDLHGAGQKVPPSMYTMWQESFRCPQLGKTHDTRSQPCIGMGVDNMPVPEGVLCQLPGHSVLDPNG